MRISDWISDVCSSDLAAFKALRKANALRRRQLGWDAAAARRKVGALLAAFAQPLAGAPQATLGEQMVFVVSMPQGGTDAVAQVLATHAQAGHVEKDRKSTRLNSSH